MKKNQDNDSINKKNINDNFKKIKDIKNKDENEHPDDKTRKTKKDKNEYSDDETRKTKKDKNEHSNDEIRKTKKDKNEHSDDEIRKTKKDKNEHPYDDSNKVNKNLENDDILKKETNLPNQKKFDEIYNKLIINMSQQKKLMMDLNEILNNYDIKLSKHNGNRINNHNIIGFNQPKPIPHSLKKLLKIKEDVMSHSEITNRIFFG